MDYAPQELIAPLRPATGQHNGRYIAARDGKEHRIREQEGQSAERRRATALAAIEPDQRREWREYGGKGAESHREKIAEGQSLSCFQEDECRQRHSVQISQFAFGQCRRAAIRIMGDIIAVKRRQIVETAKISGPG